MIGAVSPSITIVLKRRFIFFLPNNKPAVGIGPLPTVLQFVHFSHRQMNETNPKPGYSRYGIQGTTPLQSDPFWIVPAGSELSLPTDSPTSLPIRHQSTKYTNICLCYVLTVSKYCEVILRSYIVNLSCEVVLLSYIINWQLNTSIYDVLYPVNIVNYLRNSKFPLYYQVTISRQLNHLVMQ